MKSDGQSSSLNTLWIPYTLRQSLEKTYPIITQTVSIQFVISSGQATRFYHFH